MRATVQQQTGEHPLESFVSTPDDTLYQAPGFGFEGREAPPKSPQLTMRRTRTNSPRKKQNTQPCSALAQVRSSYYSSDYNIGGTTDATYVAIEEFGAVYSDAAIQCQTCVSSAVDVNTSYNDIVSRSMLNGTLWLSKNVEPTQYDQGLGTACSNIACMAYEFAFATSKTTRQQCAVSVR